MEVFPSTETLRPMATRLGTAPGRLAGTPRRHATHGRAPTLPTSRRGGSKAKNPRTFPGSKYLIGLFRWIKSRNKKQPDGPPTFPLSRRTGEGRDEGKFSI